MSEQEIKDEWAENIKNYEKSKKTLGWKDTAKPTYITHSDMKQIEGIYNPILQIYNNNETETKLKEIEIEDIKKIIAQNKDKQLRVEQTYNIINFEDKLKGFEDDPRYPKMKVGRQRKNKDTLEDYNIVSLLPFEQHHYLPPGKRPISKIAIKKEKHTTTTGLRDYDIITNRYKELHALKEETDAKIERAEQGIKYLKTHNYNPVIGQFYDPKKEENFQQERSQKEKAHGKDFVKSQPIIVQNDGLLYNPVSNIPLDEERLNSKLLREGKKKERYKFKYEYDSMKKMQDLECDEIRDKMVINRFEPIKYTDFVPRGYDILTNKEFLDNNPRILFKPNTESKLSAWEIISKNMKTQNNFNTKGMNNFEPTKDKENKNQISLVDNAGQVKTTENKDPKIENFQNNEKKLFGETQEHRERKRQTEKLTKGDIIPTSFQKAATNLLKTNTSFPRSLVKTGGFSHK